VINFTETPKARARMIHRRNSSGNCGAKQEEFRRENLQGRLPGMEGGTAAKCASARAVVVVMMMVVVVVCVCV
jgi:hypothetical protein